MCHPEFSITTLESYFHPLTPREADGQVDKMRAGLIIASYFTVIIPLVCGIVYACSSLLRGRVTDSLRDPNTASVQRVFAGAIPVSVPESPPTQSAPLLTFHEELEAWVAREGGHAREAADRIERAYQNNSTSLDLSALRLNTLPPVIGQLLQLRRLYLNSNRLTTLPAAIGNLLQLQELYLDSNQLTTLPAAIGNLLQLQKLYLHLNQLTTLPAEIGNLLQLQVLSLSANRLTTLPAAIGQLLRLQRLNLSANRLTTLPAEIGNLLQLQVLNLHSNRLTTLPAEIGNLLQLQELYLNLNQLTTLPAEIGRLLQLRRLELQDNPALFEIPVSFCNLLNITHLDINRTAITHALQDLVLATIRRQRDAVAVKA